MIVNDHSPSFADDAIAAVNSPKRGVAGYIDSHTNRALAARLKTVLRQSRRFEATQEVVELAYNLSLLGFERILDFIKAAHAPHQKIWIEWDEPYRQTLVRKHHNQPDTEEHQTGIAARIGYLIETKEHEGGSTYHMTPFFTSADVPSDQIFICPLGYCLSPDHSIADLIHQSGFFVHLSTKSLQQQHLPPQNIGLGPKEYSELVKIAFHNKRQIVRFDEDGNWNQDFSYLQGKISEQEWKVIEGILNDSRMALGVQYCHQQFNPDTTSQTEAQKKFEFFNSLSKHFCPFQSEYSPLVFESLLRTALKNYTAETAKLKVWNALKHSTTGDIRFIISLLAMINYNWIAKGEPVRSHRQSIAFGKRKAHSEYYKLAIALPKDHAVIRETARGTGSPKRQHEVRGHFRVIRRTGKPDRRTWIKPHRRGDPKLGVITKDYVLVDNKA